MIDAAGGARFATTRWTQIVQAGADSSPEARRALSSLCEAYWMPLYAFARRGGADVHEAQDLVQGFFASVLEKDYFADADRRRGRFRTFLLAAFRHHSSKERDKAAAQKRGGGVHIASLDFARGEEVYQREPAHTDTPERVFERRWALTLLDHVLQKVRAEFRDAGREALFDALRPYLVGGSPLPSYRSVGDALGMTEGAIKVAVHRLRRRYRDVLRAEIADTVDDPARVDEELRHLMAAVG